MRSAMIAGLAAAGLAIGGAEEASARQTMERWGYCNGSSGNQNIYSDVFRADLNILPNGNLDLSSIAKQFKEANSTQSALCWFSFTSAESARGRRDFKMQEARERNPGRSVVSVSWSYSGSSSAPQSSAPPPASQSEQWTPEMPSLVVHDTRAEDEERARQLNEDNARRNREAAERDAATRARYEQQQRDHEAAMARHRAAQERFRRECESNRAQGGSCVSPM